MKAKVRRWSWCTLVVAVALIALPYAALAAGPTALVVPVDPNNTTFPHTTYPLTGTTEATILLGATLPSAAGSTDSFTVDWSFGDGSPDVILGPFAGTATTAPYAYDISTTHQYPASAGVGTAWTATVTVTDVTTSTTGSPVNYYVIQEANGLPARVNVAIDWGLWYMHKSMWRRNANSISPGNPPVDWGGWDYQAGTPACPNVSTTYNDGYNAFDCGPYASIDASNVQAFEVNGHLQSGPATDPYTDDVARGLARMLTFVAQTHAPTTASDTADAFSIPAVTYNYNPATSSFTCADGSIPLTTDPTCSSHGGQHQYNASAASCPAPPCTIAYDGNGNGLMAYSADGSGQYSYTTSPFLDALVASGTPAAVAATGSYAGQTYKTIVQDLMDFYGFSQYGSDCDVSTGSVRGNGGSCAGGAWLYGPRQGNDNSTSQWAAIGFISGERGFGLSVPASITDFNNVWVTNAQDVQHPAPTGADSFASGQDLGAYGYRGSFYYSNAWGPFAVTPSGMVQMAMDGVGRTKSTSFGDSSSDFDQRWNDTESFYADNFCNSVSPYNQAYYAPRAYMYGLYSFTKSMLLHTVGNSLQPIQYLRTLTPGVFTTDASVPPNTIDWYAALSPTNGGTDPCDGVAQTLVGFQQAPAYGTFDGHWWGNTYDVGGAAQSAYETSWALIMLQRTVFVSCIKNLQGRGTPGNRLSPPRIDLTWTGQTNATSYAVLRSDTSGGPYTQLGTTTNVVYSDRSKSLVNGNTYYYVVQPINGTSEICQSNEAKVTIP